MSTAPRAPFLRRVTGALRPPVEPDLADMGTAVALDFTLDQPEDDALSASVLPGATSVRPPATGGSWRRWLGRKPG